MVRRGFGWRRAGSRLPGVFWLYFAGQTASNLGAAFTTVALPLLVFRLTGSPTDLGAATAVTYGPWVLFGLVGGAVMDRVDRKRVMVATDVGRAVVISLLPLLAVFGALDLAWIYAVSFVQSTLQILFSGGEYTAVVALVADDDLVGANSRLSGSYSVATVAGTAAAGLAVQLAPVADALWIDGLSFLVSAASLAAIPTSFNAVAPSGLGAGGWRAIICRLVADTRVGLEYVWRRPVLRVISLLVMVVNLFGSAATSELAFFAVRRLGADNAQVGYLYAASSAGVLVLSLAVAPLARRVPTGRLAIVALVLYGSGMAALGLSTSYGLGLVLEGCIGAATVLFNVSSMSLRQKIVPNELLGRASNAAIALAWCAIPVGSLAGGAIVAATHRIDLVYAGVGAAVVLVALAATRSALVRSDEAGGGRDETGGGQDPA